MVIFQLFEFGAKSEKFGPPPVKIVMLEMYTILILALTPTLFGCFPQFVTFLVLIAPLSCICCPAIVPEATSATIAGQQIQLSKHSY